MEPVRHAGGAASLVHVSIDSGYLLVTSFTSTFEALGVDCINSQSLERMNSSQVLNIFPLHSILIEII